MMEKLVETIYEEINQLEQWADEAEGGGWSTKHVFPMRERASKLRKLLLDMAY